MLKLKIEEMSTLKPGGYEDSRIVKSCVPVNMAISVPKNIDGVYSVVARITWLCKTVQDTLFCLTTNYVAENQEDEEFLLTNPLLDDRYFSNYRLCSNMLISSLSHFFTDLNFTFSKSIHKANDTEISCQGLEVTDDASNDKLHKIMVSPEVFASMKFIDEYILDGIYNNADFNSAISLGSNDNNNTYIFEVEKIKLKGIAPTDKKKYKDNAAVMVNVSNNSESDTEFTILFPISLGKKYKKKAFNKVTLEDLSINYLDDENHYISKFCFSGNNIKEDSDEYLFIESKNKDNDGILFAMSAQIQSDLIQEITNVLENINNKEKLDDTDR